MDHQNPMADSIKKRLSMQNEILKRVEEVSEKMQRRAEEVTRELHGLEDQAGAVERDLKNTFNLFRNLSNTRFVENRISEEDVLASHTKDSAKSSVDGGIPAQSYEMDILPRYKEALSLGLTSYRDHIKKTNKRYSTGPVFKLGSVRGPLPHIIGSEEYIHDNSCGLIEDLVLGTSLDFNGIVEQKGVYSDAKEHSSRDLFNANLFGMEQGPSEKDGSEPLASAALDFKAMLEAALLNPYKFYDEESSSHAVNSNNTSNEQTCKDLDQVTPEVGTSRHLQDSQDTILPVFEGNLTALQGSDIHIDNFSALISAGLFDTEEEALPSAQKHCDDTPSSVAESTFGSVHAAEDSTFADSSVGICKGKSRQGAPSDVDDDVEKDKTSKDLITSPHNLKNDASLSTIDIDNKLEVSKEVVKSDLLAISEEAAKLSGSSQVSLQDAKGLNSQLSDDLQKLEISSTIASISQEPLEPRENISEYDHLEEINRRKLPDNTTTK